jgi:(p)ppGpp synthase/HD superfamily hydrolase
MPEQPVILSDRFVRAVDYAMVIHATQVRKGTMVPYTAHLLGVAGLVLEADGDEDLAIAGLLHDAVVTSVGSSTCSFSESGAPEVADVSSATTGGSSATGTQRS